MKHFWQKAVVALLLPLLLSCSPSKMEEEVLETTVYGETSLPKMEGNLTYSFEGKDIFVDEEKHTVSGTKAGTETLLHLENGKEKKDVLVKVTNRPYESRHAKAEEREGWFKEVEIDPIARKEGFANGMDISSCKQLIDAGTRYYNEEGVEESLFRILSEHEVNWVRFRLWNDPYNHNNQDSPYGGGGGDLSSTLWMAKQAKYFGLNILLDLHYSDFWTDPGSQVIPKAWANLATSNEMAEAISSYTSKTLQEFAKIGATPDMIAIGNEVTGGMLYQLPGEDKASLTGGNPGYIDGKKNAPSLIAGTVGTENFKKYLKAGLDAVHSIDSKILTMVHIAQSFTNLDAIQWFYDEISDLSYDVIGLSAYSYYHYESQSILESSLSSLSAHFPSKKIAIAETSYGFTYEGDENASNTFYSSGDAKPINGYPCSIQGQASIISDAIKAVASLSNGFGLFYWEGAWTPRKGCGWGDERSKCSWANQGLFSYDGKALGSLSLFQKTLS